MDVTALNSVYNNTTALSTSVKGVQDSGTRFAKAASDVVQTYAAAANVVSGADLSPEAMAAASDPVTPMVDMMTSQRAYEANLKVFSAVNEMEDSLMDVLA